MAPPILGRAAITLGIGPLLVFFCFSLDYFVLVFFLPYCAERLAGKNVSKMTYFLSSGTQNLNPVSRLYFWCLLYPSGADPPDKSPWFIEWTVPSWALRPVVKSHHNASLTIDAVLKSASCRHVVTARGVFVYICVCVCVYVPSFCRGIFRHFMHVPNSVISVQ